MNKDELNVVLEQHSLWLNTSGKEGARAYLSQADLSGANLTGANLSRAYLVGTNLSKADLSEAYLSYVNLSGANLTGANLSRAYLSGCIINGIIGKEIITFQANKHFAYYADGYISIGCKYHSVAYWLENYKDIGEKAKYSPRAIEAYGDWVKLINKNFRGEVI
jgi:uncharacterized protein YjbI with pentapeptide repeats